MLFSTICRDVSKTQKKKPISISKEGSDYVKTSNSVFIFWRIYKATAIFARATKMTATFTAISSATSYLRKTRQNDKATPLEGLTELLIE